MNIPSTEILVRPLMSEKSYLESQAQKYRFEVHPKANKIQVAQAVQALFKVKVVDVNMAKVHGKRRRYGRHFRYGADWKKAVVTLAEGSSLDFFEKA